MRKFEPIFEVGVLSHGNRRILIHLTGEYHNVPFHTDYYNTSLSVESLLNEINEHRPIGPSNKDCIGLNDRFFLVKGDLTEVIAPLRPTEEGNVYPIPTDYLIEVLTKYKDWLVEYESCRIPGVIPADKLETWVCVPRLFVNEELLKNLHLH